MKNHFHFWITLSVLAILPVLNTTAKVVDREETFFRANQAYKEGRFQDAVDGYEKLIQSGYNNGHLYFNLGNSHFRQDQLGKAILNYERARTLMPRDADLNFNLRHARDQVKDAIAEQPGFLGSAFFWTKSLAFHELFWGFAVLNLLFWGILFIRFFTKMEWTFYFSIILLIFWLITGISFGLKWYGLDTDNRAIILHNEVSIFAGPNKGDTILFKLHEGTTVSHERTEGDWSLVSLPDEKRGWIEAEAVEKIRVD